MTAGVANYDETYFAWQSTIGEFGGWANRQKFEEFIKPGDHVLDFGCGGGFLLKGFTCAEKLGVEVNETARANAASLGVQTVASTDLVADGWADIIVSNHALEHCESPLAEVRKLLPKVKPGGRIVFVVPCEHISYMYRRPDINGHLYSWSPMNLANLFECAGFQIEECRPYFHKWPPYYQQIARLAGKRLFNLIARAYSRVERTWYQVRVVARRPA